MKNYDALSPLLCVMLMLGLFLVLCVSIYMLCLTLRKRSAFNAFLLLLCIVFSGSLLILYDADVRSRKYGFAPAAISRWICEKPVVYVVLLWVLMVAFLISLSVREIRLRSQTITHSAIKESIDHLPTGLCFYSGNGRVMLSNHRMNQLCHDLLGYDLQDAVAMWESIRAGAVQSGVVTLTIGNHPSFRLPDGTVWTFSQEEIQCVFQITATDTTRLFEVAGVLEQRNEALAAMRQRLKQYEVNVEELTRNKERLRTKTSIHSELGQALMATRSYLLGNQESTEVPVEAWRRSVALMRQETVEGSEEFSLQMFIQTARAYGIKVEIDGGLPKQKTSRQLFMEAATEALTNAVRHADARMLRVRFLETEEYAQVRFQNDGRSPESEIIEGGGLGALRRKVEMAGGSMDIEWQPRYTLTITVVKERGEILCPEF